MKKRTIIICSDWNNDADPLDKFDIEVPDCDDNYIKLEANANARALSVLRSLPIFEQKITKIYIKHIDDKSVYEYTFYSPENFEILNDFPHLWRIAAKIFGLIPDTRLQLEYNNFYSAFDYRLVGKDYYIDPDDDDIEIVTYFNYPCTTLDDIIDDVREFLKTK